MIFWLEYVANPVYQEAVERLKRTGSLVLWFRLLTAVGWAGGLVWLAIVLIFNNRPDPEANPIEGQNISFSVVCVVFLVGLTWLADVVCNGAVWLIRLRIRRFVKEGKILKLDDRVVAVYESGYRKGYRQRYDGMLYSLQRRHEDSLRNLLPREKLITSALAS